MTRCVVMTFIVTVSLVFAGFGGDLPQILQPNATAFSEEDVAVLEGLLADLEGVLDDDTLGSQRVFSAGSWQSRDFAVYTAGRLGELEYETLVVQKSEGTGKEHVWSLVGLPLLEQTAWIPVEASPEPEHSQERLGHIPTIMDEEGIVWFKESYVTYDEVVELSPNLPPIAKIRSPYSLIGVRETVKFIALGSYDPDGEIVLYLWDFGDGTTSVHTSPVYRYAYGKKGDYTLTLTVIDNRGKPATTSVDVRVGQREEISPPSSSDGCGCGG